jgi:uroporphyrinogen decarboxylase
MSYAIEGGGSKTNSKAKKWLYIHPEATHRLLRMITDLNVGYLVQQVKAGAQMLQVFESNAEYLSPELFAKYSLPYLAEIAKRVKEELKALNIDPVPMVCREFDLK